MAPPKYKTPYKNQAKKRYVTWPPKVIDVTSLGYLRDLSGNSYTRDIGRSTRFSDGMIAIQFGDTFAHNLQGEFVGMTDNTCALALDPLNPTLSTYQPSYAQSSKNLHSEKALPAFIERFKDEEDIPGVRYKFWSFSGIVEYENDTEEGFIHGWTWFEKRDVVGKVGNLGRGSYQYTGIAQVIYDYGSRFPGIAAVRRELPFRERALFKASQTYEPRLGSFCAVSDKRHIFVYGHLDGQSKNVGVGRVQPLSADNRKAYEFWDGKRWVGEIRSCASVLQNMQHGQIFLTDMFSPSSKSPWAFVGCNATGDSQVIFGRSPAPQGPFTLATLIDAQPLRQMPYELFTYTMYAHTWAFDKNKGDLMITWSEGTMHGNVVAVKVRMQTKPKGKLEPSEITTKDKVQVKKVRKAKKHNDWDKQGSVEEDDFADDEGECPIELDKLVMMGKKKSGKRAKR